MKYHKKQALNTNDEHIYDEKLKLFALGEGKKAKRRSSTSIKVFHSI